MSTQNTTSSSASDAIGMVHAIDRVEADLVGWIDALRAQVEAGPGESTAPSSRPEIQAVEPPAAKPAPSQPVLNEQTTRVEELEQRVARAIYSKWAEIEMCAVTFDDLLRLHAADSDSIAKKFHRMAFEEARAAIAVIRNPTPRMIRAGEDYMGDTAGARTEPLNRNATFGAADPARACDAAGGS